MFSQADLFIPMPELLLAQAFLIVELPVSAVLDHTHGLRDDVLVSPPIWTGSDVPVLLKTHRSHNGHPSSSLRSCNYRRICIPTGDTPFCPPAGRVRQIPPWNPYDDLTGNLQATFQRAPLHALLVSRSCITYEEAMSTFPQ